MTPASVPSSPLDLNVVGLGRLGSTVAAVLEAEGHRVHRVRRGEPIPERPLTWLTVPDAAIAEVAAECPPVGVLLHASGASDLDVLGAHPCPGSLHPLMTFPGGVVPAPPVPAAISGLPRAREAAFELARALSWSPFPLSGDRRAYHAAAVIAGNFATTLLAEAARLLAVAGVEPAAAPGLLAPLALQSLRNAARIGPAAALTGPVVRGDEAVLAAHRAVIADRAPDVLPTYDALVRATRGLVSLSRANIETKRD